MSDDLDPRSDSHASTQVIPDTRSSVLELMRDAAAARYSAEGMSAELGASESRYRDLFNSMSAGFCIIEVVFDANDQPVDYRFIETNAAFEGQTGLVDARGRSIRELAPEIEPRWFEIYGKVVRTGEPIHVVDEAKALDRWFEVSASRVGGPESCRVAVVFTDLTEAKRAEDALQLSEERLRLAIDGAQMGAWAWDLGTDEIRWSEGNERLLGYALGRPVRSYADFEARLHPEDAKRVQAAMRQCTEQGVDVRSEFRVLWPDGSVHWLSSFGRRQTDSAGLALQVVGTLVDITERKRIDAMLTVSELRYRRLFQTAKDGILILNTHTARIVDVNPFMTQMLGYSHEHFLGKELWEIGLFSDRPANEAAVRELRTKGYVRFEHLPLESSNGRAVEVEIVANVYQEGRQSVIQCNIRDITERASMERQLSDQAAVVSDLHRRKDEFLAMLSHELRSPLAPIASALQLLSLQRERESPLQRQALSIIERQVGQLQHLVDDLLEVSRITTGRLHLRKEPVSVRDVVDGAVETARPLIEHHRHQLTLAIPPEPVWVCADVARLEQILVNLLTNAAKFTHEGGHIGLTVELAAQRGDPAGRVLIRVRDDGVGISPALVPHVFELFSQSERSMDRAQGGLGIGLALVQRLTELHGGTVQVHSVLGEGSEFVVSLPTVSPTPATAGLSDSAGTPAATSAIRVLVVDDDEDTATSFKLLLEALGHEVRVAHDGPSAVEAAKDFLPQVALLDIGLPGLNGYEVAKRIRANPATQATVLVALTGYGQDSDRQTSRDAGFNHHLVKPARLEQLREILASLG